MEYERKPPVSSEGLPHIGLDVVGSLPEPEDTQAIDRIVGDFGEDQGDFLRAAIPWVNRLRDEGADPGDSLLMGAAMYAAAQRAQVSLDQFRSDSNVTALFPDKPRLEAVPDLPPAKQSWRERRAAHRQERHARRVAAKMHVALGVVVLETVRNSRKPSGDDAA